MSCSANKAFLYHRHLRHRPFNKAPTVNLCHISITLLIWMISSGMASDPVIDPTPTMLVLLSQDAKETDDNNVVRKRFSF